MPKNSAGGFAMPNDIGHTEISLLAHRGCKLSDLVVGKSDSIGAQVYDVLFRGCDYAIYRSDRGIYVHFSDDEQKEQGQRRAYSLLCGQICELRYLTTQMRPSVGRKRAARSQELLYDHNMAQALMLLMESEAQRAATQTP